MQAICQKFLQLRQRLIPYAYGLAHENAVSGVPLARPLLLEYPQDATAPGVSDEYLWGSAFLAAPVTTAGATSRTVYVPAGHWTNYWTNQVVTGPATLPVAAPLEQMPLMVRGGSIVPMQNVMPSSTSFALDTLTLDIFPADTASFTLYEDDGASYAYEGGAASTTALSLGGTGGTARIHIGAASGSYSGQPASRTWIAQLRHVTATPSSVSASGGALAARADSVALATNASGWWYDAAGSRLLVKLRLAAASASEIAIAGAQVADVTVPAGERGRVRLAGYDIRGRRVADLSNAIAIAGTGGTATLRAQALPQGVYFVLLRAGRGQGRLRLAVVR